MKTQIQFKPYQPNQLLLLPPDMKQWLPEDDLAYFIMDVVNGLDLSSIYQSYDSSKGGQPPFDPKMMTSLLLYAYCVGIPSSRKIEKATYYQIPFRVLTADQQPDHDTIAEFRKRHLKALSGLFVEALRLCQKVGLVKLGHVSLDGTKIKANASKHKAMSYGRMEKKAEELEAEVDRLLKQAQAVDDDEDSRYGKGKEPKAQRNFTDPESRIMKDGASKSFEQSYNCQAGVDEKSQVIVATSVTQEPNDKQQVKPLVKKIKKNTEGDKPGKISADSGYFSETNVDYLETEGIEGFIATGRQKHGDVPATAGRGRIPKDATKQERMSRKLRTKKGRETYSKRKHIVEPVFGQIKEARGFRRFLLRGLENVSAEWDIICLTHNLLKLFRSGLMAERA